MDIKYDKIKKLGEYILVKKNKLFGALDMQGNPVCGIKYKKITLDRNVLKLDGDRNKSFDIMK